MGGVFKNSRDQKLWNKIFGIEAVPPRNVRVEDIRRNKDGTFSMIFVVKAAGTKKYYLFSHVEPTRMEQEQDEMHISFRRIKPTYIYE